MSDDAFVSCGVWLGELLEPHSGEVRDRALILHRELDERLHLRRDPDAQSVLARLLRFVFATVPDGCEIFLAASRGDSPVTVLGSGVLTLRWQVVGAEPAPGSAGVAPIHPIPGGALHHATSRTARELVRRFEGLGWRMALEAVRGDRELWAQIRMH